MHASQQGHSSRTFDILGAYNTVFNGMTPTYQLDIIRFWQLTLHSRMVIKDKSVFFNYSALNAVYLDKKLVHVSTCVPRSTLSVLFFVRNYCGFFKLKPRKRSPWIIDLGTPGQFTKLFRRVGDTDSPVWRKSWTSFSCFLYLFLFVPIVSSIPLLNYYYCTFCDHFLSRWSSCLVLIPTYVEAQVFI